MKNYDIERGQCQLTETNCLLLNKGSTIYSWHCFIAVVLLYIAFINEKSKISVSSPNSWTLHVVVAVVGVALIAQVGFPRVNYEAQKCAQPEDRSVVWTDKSRFWFRDPFFLIMVLFSLMYGLGVFASPHENVHLLEKIMCFDASKLLPSANGKMEIVARAVSVLPTAAFVYYFVWKVIANGSLIKPVQSDLYGWEAPVAAVFSLVFIPFGLYALFGSRLFNRESTIMTWVTRAFTFRPLVAVFLFAAVYVFIWRLQGGLFLNKEDSELLQKQVKAARLAQDRRSKVGRP